MQPAVTLIGGQVGALTGRLLDGPAVFLAKLAGILFNVFWSAEMALLALVLFLKMQS